MSDSNQTSLISFKTSVCEAVGIFTCEQDLQATIDDLLTSGFAYCELSLRSAETDATAGRVLREPSKTIQRRPISIISTGRHSVMPKVYS